MPDALARIKQGEKKPIYGQVAMTTGTITISGQPTCTLKDSAGNVVAGFNGINVTGYDAGALATVRVWLDIDTVTPTALAVGFYTLVFKFSANGSDSLARIKEPSVLVHVMAA